MQEEFPSADPHSEPQITSMVQQFNQKLSFVSAPQKIEQQKQQKPSSHSQSKKQKSYIIVDDRYASELKKLLDLKYPVQNFDQYVSNLISPQTDVITKHKAAIGIKRLFSKYQVTFQTIVASGIVPELIKYAHQSEYPQLQLQSIWALINLTGGDSNQCSHVLEKVGMQFFLNILKHPISFIQQQGLYALGNLAVDGAQNRKQIIQLNGIGQICQLIRTNMNIPYIVHNGIWALTNLCRGNPLPDFTLVRQGILIIIEVFTNHFIQDKEVHLQCLWAISYHLQKILNSSQNLLPPNIPLKLISIASEYLQNNQLQAKIPSFRVLTALTENGHYADYFLQIGGMQKIQELLHYYRAIVRAETYKIVRNLVKNQKHGTFQHSPITLSTQFIINPIFESLFVSLIDQLKKTDPRTTPRVCSIYTEMISSSNFHITMCSLNFFDKHQIFEKFVQLLIKTLKENEQKVSIQIFKFISKALQIGEMIKSNHINPFVQKFKKYDINTIVALVKEFHDEDLSQVMSEMLAKYPQIQYKDPSNSVQKNNSMNAAPFNQQA